jgi:ankyrin repeat protein
VPSSHSETRDFANELHAIPSDQTIITILSNISQSKSVKLFSHGRGLAAHLHAVHTPWNPGKAEIKRRLAAEKRMKNEQKRLHAAGSTCHDARPMKRAKLNDAEDGSLISLKWDPSSKEIDEWNKRVLEVVELVELQSKKGNCDDDTANKTDFQSKLVSNVSSNNELVGTDRSGNICKSYRESLPPFLAAAAEGDVESLKKYVSEHDKDSKNNMAEKKVTHLQNLITCRDRNGSTAEHWAAGGGHVDCLAYLLELRDMVYKESKQQATHDLEKIKEDKSDNSISDANKKIRRRRDGKTSLHYAARNGQIACIDLIMARADAPSIDVQSGDGTTPLHMACYGGNYSTARHLIEKYKANAHAVNEWSCGAGHWAAMSLGMSGMDAVIELCNYLKDTCGVDFTARQKQGHTPLHKAAAKKNQAVIEWLAGKSVTCNDSKSRNSENYMRLMGQPDDGNNIPSDIWLSVGGSTKFAHWMKDKCGW